MSDANTDRCDRLLSEIEHALTSVKAALLTEGQYEDIRRVQDDVRALCAASKFDEAEQATKVALAIIKEGPPGS